MKKTIIIAVALIVILVFAVVNSFSLIGYSSINRIYNKNSDLFSAIVTELMMNSDGVYLIEQSNYRNEIINQELFERLFNQGFTYVSTTDGIVLFCKDSKFGSTAGIAYINDLAVLDWEKYYFELIEGRWYYYSSWL
jgi:hypothetical protein